MTNNQLSNSTNVKNMVLCGLFTALIIIGAFIKIPTPFVPITLQFLFCNLAGLLLGRKLGSIAVLNYIILGLIGLPVFTGGGGVGYILKPTFGYIIGFFLGAYVSGFFSEKAHVLDSKSLFKYMLIGSFASLIIVYTLGIAYLILMAKLYLGSTTPIWNLLMTGLILPIPKDIIFCVLSAVLASRVKPAVFRTTA